MWLLHTKTPGRDAEGLQRSACGWYFIRWMEFEEGLTHVYYFIACKMKLYFSKFLKMIRNDFSAKNKF